MKASELRIGNYILQGRDISRVVQIEERYANKFRLNDTLVEEGQGYFLPLPLTEEWLLKFGFERVDPVNEEKVSNAYQIPSWDRVCIVNGKLISDEYYFLDGLTTEIKYAHQLQNLYFALTGKELTIKP